MDEKKVLKVLESDVDSLASKRAIAIELNDIKSAIDITRLLKDSLDLMYKVKHEQPSEGVIRLNDVSDNFLSAHLKGTLVHSITGQFDDIAEHNIMIFDAKRYFEFGVKDKRTTVIQESHVRGVGKSYAIVDLASETDSVVIYPSQKQAECTMQANNKYAKWAMENMVEKDYGSNIVFVDGVKFETVMNLIYQGYIVIGSYR